MKTEDLEKTDGTPSGSTFQMELLAELVTKALPEKSTATSLAPETELEEAGSWRVVRKRRLWGYFRS